MSKHDGPNSVEYNNENSTSEKLKHKLYNVTLGKYEIAFFAGKFSFICHIYQILYHYL